MNKKIKFLYPLLFFLFVTLSFFYPTFTKGLLPIPSDTIIGLYHPYRDLYAPEYPRGIPYKNFLITDPVRQQYPWRTLAITQEKVGQLPLWNPYNFAGTPLLANMQSAALYPLNIFFFIMPFHYAWTLLVMLQPLLGAYFLYLYLRNWHIHRLASILGGITFAFSGFSIVWLEWNIMSHVVMWLPLVLLAKEKLLQKISWKWIGVLVFAECMTFFAGHLQLLFYTLVISNVYLTVRIVQLAYARKGKNIFASVGKIYAPFLLIGLVVFTITSLQWLQTAQFIAQSARDVDMADWRKEGWFIPWHHMAQFIAPDFFGNPTTLNYWGTWNYAELVGYIGLVPLVFALYALLFRRDKKTLFFGVAALISLFFALPTFLAVLPYQLQLPLFSTSQPTRLLYVVDFALAILSALGFDYYLKHKKYIFVPILLVWLAIGGLWVYVLSLGKDTLLIDNLLTAKRNLYLPTFIFGVAMVLFIADRLIKLKGKFSYIFVGSMIVVTLFDLFRFGHKFTPFTQQTYLFPSTKTIEFLQKNLGHYRIMTTDDRILPPNFSSMYGIQSVDGYDPLYLRRYAELIAASERGVPNIDPPFGFNRIITPHRYESKIIDLLGVKYVLSLTDLDSPKLKKVFQEGETRVYENKDVMPRAFFVKFVQTATNKEEAIDRMFESNLEEIGIVELAGSNLKANFGHEWSVGSVMVNLYSDNEIIIKIKNEGVGFLVLTDTFYPTWHATVGGKETQIYRMDYNFRGVIVPAGEHEVRFYNTLF